LKKGTPARLELLRDDLFLLKMNRGGVSLTRGSLLADPSQGTMANIKVRGSSVRQKERLRILYPGSGRRCRQAVNREKTSFLIQKKERGQKMPLIWEKRRDTRGGVFLKNQGGPPIYSRL